METKPETQQPSAIEKVKSAARKKFEGNISVATELKQQVEAIQITDENTLAMANQLLSKIKECYNQAEEKRVTLKNPYLEAGKEIDAIAKLVLTPMKDALDIGKGKLKEWNDAQNERLKQAEELLAKKKNFLDTLIIQIKEKCDKCVTPEQCIRLYNSISEQFPAAEKFGPYADEAMAEKKRYMDLLKLKGDTLAAALAGGAGSTEAVAQMKQAEAKAVEASAEVSAAVEEKKQEISQAVSDELTKSKVRKTWKAVIVDESKLPRQWLMPDMEVINEFLKDSKETLLNPSEINGVKFYIHEEPVIK